MRFLLLLAGLLLLGGLSQAEAADAGFRRKPATPPAMAYRIIPHSPEASLIWAGDACWRGCAQDCGRQLKVCLSVDRSGNCLAQNGACDRFCQRECRSYGGPLLPLD